MNVFSKGIICVSALGSSFILYWAIKLDVKYRTCFISLGLTSLTCLRNIDTSISCCYSEHLIRMQLRYGLCELCRSVLYPHPRTSIISVAKFHHHPVCYIVLDNWQKLREKGAESALTSVSLPYTFCPLRTYFLMTYGGFVKKGRSMLHLWFSHSISQGVIMMTFFSTSFSFISCMLCVILCKREGNWCWNAGQLDAWQWYEKLWMGPAVWTHIIISNKLI